MYTVTCMPASSCILPEFDPCKGSLVYFHILKEKNHFPPKNTLLPPQVLIMPFDMLCHHAYMHTQHVSMTQVPVIFHFGNILIALWHNRYAREIHFTVELQFCQKLYRDHLCSPSLGEYFIILLDLLTIRPWRDHSSDRNAWGTLCTDLFVSFCILRHFQPQFDIFILCACQND